MSEPPMHELAARLARGDEAAFGELYDACADRLHRYLTSRLGSREAASDVLQTAFLRVVKSRKQFRGVENPVAYLFQIARNEALRVHGRRYTSGRPLEAVELAVESGTTEQWDDTEVVAAALARLTDDDREIVDLKLFAGLTFREIADVLDVPPAKVATRYRRALESLRPWLEKQFR